VAETPEEFTDRMRSVGFLSQGRTRRLVAEGRAHPDSGRPYKATTDPDLGATTTEHATRDDRVDVTLRPKTIRTAIPLRRTDVPG
jgi:hypothetical protein